MTFLQKYTWLGLILLVLGAGILLMLDSPGGEDAQPAPDGKLLAARYCQSCHMLPTPSLLDKARWSERVLPVMGLYLGTTPHQGIKTNVVEDSLFPKQPLLAPAQWAALCAYYIREAPERLPAQPSRAALTEELSLFGVEQPSSKMFYGTTSITSLVKIDSSVSPHRLLVANSNARQLMVFNKALELQEKLITRGPIVDIFFEPGGALACTIGKEVVANDEREGSVGRLPFSRGDRSFPTLFDSLARPVQVQRVDLDQKGGQDYLLSEFGNLTGGLTWMQQVEKGRYVRREISRMPGALRTIIHDYNHDGLPDLFTQFSQGEEGLFLFTNRGDGRFEQRNLVRFPPSYGSSSFELADFNGDGHADILYTCGDNGDYSRILKPYHGIYLFLNDGEERFRQRYFFPINGCYKALARDFDGDGDLDIASISFFPAAATPWEAFVYLENQGNFSFKPFTLPPGTLFQKGVTLDAGDLDGDGRIDLVLGSGYFTSDTLNGHKEPLFIFLHNKGTGKH